MNSQAIEITCLTLNFNLWPPKSNQFIFESSWTLVLYSKKCPSRTRHTITQLSIHNVSGHGVKMEETSVRATEQGSLQGRIEEK